MEAMTDLLRVLAKRHLMRFLFGLVKIERAFLHRNVSCRRLSGFRTCDHTEYRVSKLPALSANFCFDFMQDGDCISVTRYDTVCAGCPTAEGAETCEKCTIDDPGRVPAGCAQPPDGAVDVAGATLETLEIEPGWYRATNTSIKIFQCYRENACLGGQTGGEDFCASGYTGPCE